MTPRIVQETREGIILTVHIQPNASRTEVAGLYGAALKIRVAAPPVDGAANAEIIRFLARELSIPQRLRAHPVRRQRQAQASAYESPVGSTCDRAFQR